MPSAYELYYVTSNQISTSEPTTSERNIWVRLDSVPAQFQQDHSLKDAVNLEIPIWIAIDMNEIIDIRTIDGINELIIIDDILNTNATGIPIAVLTISNSQNTEFDDSITLLVHKSGVVIPS